MSTRANEPAYPCEVVTRYCGGPLNGETNVGHVGGLTIREYYAGLAMQGLLAGRMGYQTTPEHWCQTAVAMADALLAELAKEKPHDR